MNTFTEIQRGERPPINLLVVDEAKRAWAIPYSAISAFDCESEQILIKYGAREMALMGDNLTGLGIKLLEHRVQLINSFHPRPGDEPTAPVVSLVAPSGGPSEKLFPRTYQFKGFERIEAGEKLSYCLALTNSKKLKILGPAYSFFAHMDFFPGRIGIEYTGKRIELIGSSMDDLWAALIEHRVSSIEVEEPGSVSAAVPSEAAPSNPKPVPDRFSV